MTATRNLPGRRGTLALLCGLTVALLNVPLAPTLAAADNSQPQPAAGNMVPLILNLPKAAFVGTRTDAESTNACLEPYDPKKLRPPMLVPPGLKNVAPRSKVTCSSTNVTAEALAKLTDGDKEAYDESVTFLRRGTQWVQLDLGSPHEIFALVIWHAHDSMKVYHDVIVQVADDPQFTQQIRTLFNNDQDNSSGLGVGTDREYFETREGKLINANGVKARCIRCYSKGSSSGALNEYTEIEAYARPVQ